MEFRIADTFTDSLARLTSDEQRAVKTTAFDLQLNPASPGLSFHKLDRAKDRNFWSVRVSSDIRLIVHRSHGSLLLCYVDHDAVRLQAENTKDGSYVERLSEEFDYRTWYTFRFFFRKPDGVTVEPG